MGVKTQLAMIAALGCAALLLLRWSPADIVKINYSASANIRGLLGEGGKGTLRAAACAAAPSPKPPVSIEWTGRESMTVSYKEGVDVEVYKHEFPGSTLWLDFWDRVNRGEWEPETLWVLEWYLSRNPRSSYVDFGSWIGPTVLFAGRYAAHIYSIEPDPLSFSTLNANINLNAHILGKTHVYHQCIAPKSGLVEMSGSGESNTRMTDVLDTKFLKGGSTWKVNCRTLPQFLAEERVDMANLELIKMDTEGTELWLLPTLRPWLESLGAKKPAIWLSVHSPFWKEQDTAEHKAKTKLAWDVLSLFAHVYDSDLKEIFPAKMEPSLCPDFCTFLLSDVAYGGVTRAQADAAKAALEGGSSSK